MAEARFILIIAALLFTQLGQSRADILYLKNGRAIEGLIRNEAEDRVELEVCAGTVKFFKNEIARIERSAPQEAEAIRKNWGRQQKESQDRRLKRQLEEERAPKTIDFSKESQNIMLKVSLNNRLEARLTLDTGAELTVLKKAIAQKLRLNLDKSDAAIQLTVADGRRINAKRVILESVIVEGIEAKNVEAAVMLDDIGDSGFGDGLLGMSFLKRFNFKVDHKEKKLILEKL